MDIIFTDEDYCDELLRDIGHWSKTNGIPVDKVTLDYIEDNVDGITEKYGRGGWNGMIESDYNCETA